MIIIIFKCTNTRFFNKLLDSYWSRTINFGGGITPIPSKEYKGHKNLQVSMETIMLNVNNTIIMISSDSDFNLPDMSHLGYVID